MKKSVLSLLLLAIVIIAILMARLPSSEATAAVLTVTPSADYLPIILRPPTPTPTPVPPPPAGLANGNFEGGPIAWGQYSEQGYALILPTDKIPVPPRSGSWAAWLGGAPNEVAALMQVFTVPAGARTLTYYYWIASQDACSADYDIAGVAMTVDSEVTEEEVLDAYPLCAPTSTGGWVRRDLNISSYAGSEVLLIFLASTDDILNSNWFLDDISIDAAITSVNEPSAPDVSAAVARQDPPGKTHQSTDARLYEWITTLRTSLNE